MMNIDRGERYNKKKRDYENPIAAMYRTASEEAKKNVSYFSFIKRRVQGYIYYLKRCQKGMGCRLVIVRRA